MAVLEVLTHDGLLDGPPERQARVGALITQALERCNAPRDWSVRPFHTDDADAEPLTVVAADATRWVLERWGDDGARPTTVERSVPLRRERPDRTGAHLDRFRRPRSGYTGSRVAVPN